MGLQDTASKTALLLECARPFDPNTETAFDSPGDAAKYGNAWHEGLALHAQGKSVKPMRLAEKWEVGGDGLGAHIDSAWKQVSAWIKKEKLVIAEVEVPLAARFVEFKSKVEGIHWREAGFDAETHTYDLEPGEFGGTADLVLEGKKGRVVLDYKSGAEVEPDPKTAQLLTLSLMTRASRVAVLHYPKTSLPALYAENVSVEEQQNFALRRRRAMERVGDGSLRPGPWCRYCPAREGCPANHAELLEKTTALVSKAEGAGLSLENLDPGWFHQMWGQIEKLVKIAREQIKERVKAGEIIERPDGKVLTLQPTKPYETVSMTSIKEALGEVKAKKEIDRLRDLGALREVAPEPKLVAK